MSGINKAENSVDDALVNTVASLQRQLLELKTHPQPIGGDVLQVVSSQTVSLTFAVGAGAHQHGSFGWSLSKPFLTLFAPLMTAYVDGITYADSLPYGANVVGDKTNIMFTQMPDEANSDDVTGTRYFTFHVWNYGSSSHTITLMHRLNYPNLPLD